MTRAMPMSATTRTPRRIQTASGAGGVVQGTVPSHSVLVNSPTLDQAPCFQQRVKDLSVKQLIAQLSVE